ncbi:MAG: hypothetical protein AAGF99_11940 [Bacteroidota bacterium]
MPSDKSGNADSPFADVRAAFEKLATADKTAFIVEATVGTISSAIEETSQRVTDWFDAMDPEKQAGADKGTKNTDDTK